MNARIIKSLMDTDQYIPTMCQGVLLKYPNAWAEWEFKDRSGKLVFDKKQMTTLQDAVGYFCDLSFTKSEVQWTGNLRYIQPFFREYLRLFRPNPDCISIGQDSNGTPAIRVRGEVSSTCWFEVPVLRIISKIACNGDSELPWIEGKRRFMEKVDYIRKNIHRDDRAFTITDLGTRRAYSPEWHERIIEMSMENMMEHFAGTSNFMFAMKYGLTAHGTMSHWWLQMHQQLGPRLADFQKVALKVWAEVYDGDLGIALSDVVGFDAFLRDFGKYLAKLFDGARNDSGDPYDWGNELIQHYQSLGIAPLTKIGVFSNGLTFQIAVDLYKYFKDRIKTGFGIGTNYTNDLGVEAPRIVLKMISCSPRPYDRLFPVAKIPDTPGKGMCKDETFLESLRQTFNIRQEL